MNSTEVFFFSTVTGTCERMCVCVICLCACVRACICLYMSVFVHMCMKCTNFKLHRRVKQQCRVNILLGNSYFTAMNGKYLVGQSR